LVGVATAASAADFPAVPAKAPLPAPVIFSWSGCYVGAEGGANWGKSETTAQSGPILGANMTGSFDLRGGIAGGTIGCNVQWSNFVIGGEADFSWTNKRGTVNQIAPFPIVNTSTSRENWIDTFRGRFGYAIDRFMVYGTAGVVLVGTTVSEFQPAFGTYSESKDRLGWVVGLGGEWAFWSTSWADFTLKAEYLHAGFEWKSYFAPPVPLNGGVFQTRAVRLYDDMVRVGVNVKFNWDGPGVARY